jgi:hypothetical protein
VIVMDGRSKRRVAQEFLTRLSRALAHAGIGESICLMNRGALAMIATKYRWNTLVRAAITALVFTGVGALSAARAMAAGSINGQVLGAGAPIANATVTLWAASVGAPKQLAQAQSGADGRFAINAADATGDDVSLYLIAKGGTSSANKTSGDNLAIALMTVLGNRPAAKVTINEMTTVASVWTNAQFFDGHTISGNALGLRIAAGNVPSFVDLMTGGWGSTIQDPLNSTRTTTMANFATLANRCNRRNRARATIFRCY